MIQYRKGIVRVAETWFDEPLPTVKVDIIRCVQRSEPVRDAEASRFFTLLINLRQDPDALLAKMKKETRYEIRRAEQKDRVRLQIWRTTDRNCRNAFRSFYGEFASERRLRPLNSAKIDRFADRGCLVLSAAFSECGDALVWHSYFSGEGRVRLLHSASCSATNHTHDRAMVGRVNRYLHWRDMSEFRCAGFHTYDFGGWYQGNDAKKVAINHFKEGFGGEIALNYNCLRGLTPMGNATLWLLSKLNPGISD
jgi:hypothetical protein